VVFSYARSQSKLKGHAREAGGKARAGTPREVLFGVFDARSKAKRPRLVYYGDDSGAKEVAATLIRDVGFDPVTSAHYGSPGTASPSHHWGMPRAPARPISTPLPGLFDSRRD
jgi:hypothetical protein